MSSRADSDSAASDLARLGSELADAVVAAVPAWITGIVRMRLSQWAQAGGRPDGIDDAELLQQAADAGEQAAAAVSEPLRELLGADVDLQWTTPLALVRPLIRFATDVLEQAAVPAIERDQFEVTRFPDDLYGLTPASLAALGDDVGSLALSWGAAKAMAHRRRHES